MKVEPQVEFAGLLFIIDMTKKSTNNSFIQKAKLIHKNKYTYEKTVYKNARSKVIITCSEHGDFKQVPYSHLSNNGCPKCGTTRSNLNSRNSYEKVLNVFKKVHGDLYNYSDFKYIKNNFKVSIICKKHGSFMQSPASHSAGHGCPQCALVKSSLLQSKKFSSFLKIAKRVHNGLYSYIEKSYVNLSKKTDIICKDHGVFKQLAENHLSGQGCPKCKNIKTSKRLRNNPTGWSHINWKKAGERSKNFDSFKVYIIRCWNEDEEFYKIGKTFLTVKERFRKSKSKSISYQYEVIDIFEGEGIETSKLEKKLQKDNKKYKYTPKLPFVGMSECYKNLLNTCI